MSDIGLYSSWYERVRKMAHLIDAVLLELRTSRTSGQSAVMLSRMLTRQEASASLSRQVLSMVLRERQHVLDLDSLGNQLSNPNTAGAAIHELEQIAEILERERASTVEQMRK